MTNGSVPFYNECRFHPMRLSTKQVSGTRTRLHECCQGQMGDAGCDVGPHVWEEHRGGDKLLAHLHAEIAFAVTPETCTGGTGMRRGVVGLDCEMVYSTCGLELARVSLVDGADHSVLVDELVRPKGAVLDYNTRYRYL
ncbi:hypothetical protein BC828DRAFT_347074 [Blastocladiella britannica]|nr:hypothetical protein BC828DRAFT_347074 [Blastocladiella britannica]